MAALIEGVKVDGDLVKDTFDGIGGLLMTIRTLITGDITPDKKAEIIAAAAQAEQMLSLGQLEINKAEAANPNVFVSGWRPAVGWVCVFALAYNMILIRFIDYMIDTFYPRVNSVPVLETGELMTLLFGMLGLGAMRSFEKTKGVGRN